jgi:hypothetical protein
MHCFAKPVITIVAAIFLITWLSAPASAAGDCRSANLVLAQGVEPTKAAPPASEVTPAPAKPPQPVMPPQPQPEQMQRKSRGLGHGNDDLERAGTKKIGGEVIRAKEIPPGE